MGANIDAVETARRYGLREGHAVRFHNDQEGIELNYKVMDETITCVRESKSAPKDWLREIDEDYKGRKK